MIFENIDEFEEYIDANVFTYIVELERQVVKLQKQVDLLVKQIAIQLAEHEDGWYWEYG